MEPIEIPGTGVIEAMSIAGCRYEFGTPIQVQKGDRLVLEGPPSNLKLIVSRAYAAPNCTLSVSNK